MNQISQVKAALAEFYPPEEPRPEFAGQLDALVTAHFAEPVRDPRKLSQDVPAAGRLVRWRYPLIAASGVAVIAVVAVTAAGPGASPAAPGVGTSSGAGDPAASTSSTSAPASITSVEMPDLTGLDRRSAVDRLAGLGILVDLVVEPRGGTIYDTSRVIEQSPAPAVMVDLGTRATLTVEGAAREGGPVRGAASTSVTVPDVTGLTYAEAVGLLRAAGVTVPFLENRAIIPPDGTVPTGGRESWSPMSYEETSDPALVGKVVTQVPAAGSVVPSGTAGLVTVGKAPGPG
ncbi:PASTA domain-containing protein [Nakamurella silvestris]|nr:PASTA domain-containing protein [Nakamurella silvestris]